MTQTAYRVRRPNRERSDSRDYSSSLFNPAIEAEPAGTERYAPPSGPNLETQRQALLALRARLRGDVVHSAGVALSVSIETSSASPDTADLASEVVEQDLAVSLLGSAVGTLDQIEAALQRIEDGSYGRCAECDARIPAPRLEAIPYATCCVACAARQERGY